MNFVHELHQELTYSARRHVGDATVVRSDARAERRDGVVLIEPRRRGPKDGEVEAARGSWPAGDDRGGAGARGRGRGHARSGRRMTGAARAREDEETTARDVRPAGTAGDGRDGGGRPGRRRRMRTRTRGMTGGGGEDEPRAAAALEARRSEE